VLQASLVAKKTFSLEEVPEPEPDEDQVLLRVAYCGVCGSDIHAYRGTHPFMRFPIVLGHEFSGVVSSAGGKSRGFNKGDRVVVFPVISCGKCVNCLAGRPNICMKRKILGGQVSGAYAHFIAVDANMLIPIPEGLSLRKAALVEPVAVAIHAVRRAKINPGENVLVTGCGPIGFFVAQAAKLLAKPGKVLVLDRDDSRVEVARMNGLRAITAVVGSLSELLPEEFGERLFDTVFECTGSIEVADSLLGFARSGSRMVLVSILPCPQHIRNLTAVAEHELEIIGTSVYLKEDFTEAVRLMGEGAMSTKGVITSEFPLEEVASAFRHLDKGQGRIFKVLIKVQ